MADDSIGFDLKKVDNRRGRCYQRAIDFNISADPGDDIHNSYEEVGSFHGRVEEAVGCLEDIRDSNAITKEKALWCGKPRVKMLYGHGEHRYTVRLVYDYEKPRLIMSDEDAGRVAVKVREVLRMVRARFIADWREADRKAKVESEADNIAAQVVGYVRKRVKEQIKFDERMKMLIEELRTETMRDVEPEIEDMEINGVEIDDSTNDRRWKASDEVITAAIRKTREKAADEKIASGGRFPR